jgi:hypothetical protein
MSRLVDIDDLSAEDLAELASAKRLRELTPPWPASSELDPEAAQAFDRLQKPHLPTLLDPGPGEWLADDPRRLRAVTFEVARFCRDDRRVVEGVLTLAQTLGIDLTLAAQIVGAALRDVRHSQALSND